MEKIGNITVSYKGFTVEASIQKDGLPDGTYEVFIVGRLNTEGREVVCGNDIKEFIDDVKETVDSL